MSQKKNKTVAKAASTITSSLDSFEAAREWSDNSILKIRNAIAMAVTTELNRVQIINPLQLTPDINCKSTIDKIEQLSSENFSLEVGPESIIRTQVDMLTDALVQASRANAFFYMETERG
ncbi:MAG: hypothetical protein AUK31_07665 [Fibrobacteres bacterium CG2_30_45_31]|nr:MAG: hypothetical protein AUK31_07665 [Fibrobacteres bacterium CG2_30_45_31]